MSVILLTSSPVIGKSNTPTTTGLMKRPCYNISSRSLFHLWTENVEIYVMITLHWPSFDYFTGQLTDNTRIRSQQDSLSPNTSYTYWTIADDGHFCK